MPELIVSGVPSNINVPRGVHVAEVTGDIYSICERLKEYDPRIRVTPLRDDANYKFSIGEIGPDGVLRQILMAEELDERIIERLRYIQAVPLTERVRAIEADYDKEQARKADEEAEHLYETVGKTIHENLFSCGFTHMPKPMSVRPLNRAARRAGRGIHT